VGNIFHLSKVFFEILPLTMISGIFLFLILLIIFGQISVSTNIAAFGLQ
jgi:hypothetical protein